MNESSLNTNAAILISVIFTILPLQLRADPAILRAPTASAALCRAAITLPAPIDLAPVPEELLDVEGAAAAHVLSVAKAQAAVLQLQAKITEIRSDLHWTERILPANVTQAFGAGGAEKIKNLEALEAKLIVANAALKQAYAADPYAELDERISHFLLVTDARFVTLKKLEADLYLASRLGNEVLKTLSDTIKAARSAYVDDLLSMRSGTSLSGIFFDFDKSTVKDGLNATRKSIEEYFRALYKLKTELDPMASEQFAPHIKLDFSFSEIMLFFLPAEADQNLPELKKSIESVHQNVERETKKVQLEVKARICRVRKDCPSGATYGAINGD